MRRASFAAMRCPIAQTLEVVGDPWTLLIVRDAMFGVRRFDDFRDSLGIPRATLAARLATLVEHGVMERRDYQDRPPRHEYVLTERGRALSPVLVSMLEWGNQWTTVAEDPIQLVAVDTDEEVRPVYVDERSGRRLRDIRMRRRPTSTAPT